MELLLTIVSVIIALIALWQTKKQIELSNKHQLFDRRLEKYLFIKKLCELYSGGIMFLKEDAVICTPDIAFAFLTNTGGLEEMCKAIDKPLNQPEQTLFLKKVEQMQSLAEEIQMIWQGEEARVISEFVFNYSEVLIKLYQQHLFMGHIEKINNQSPLTENEAIKQLRHTAKETKLLETIDKLNDLYTEIVTENMLDEIKKQTQLIKVTNI